MVENFKKKESIIMLQIEKMRFTADMIIRGDTVLVTGVREVKEYVDNKPTDKVVAVSYTAVLPNFSYNEIQIRIPGKKMYITQEEIEANGGSIEATVTGFEGRFFRTKDGNYTFTSTAEKLEVVK
jgi:hypothetical protein